MVARVSGHERVEFPESVSDRPAPDLGNEFLIPFHFLDQSDLSACSARSLERNGFIRRQPGVPRSIEILLPPENLPILEWLGIKTSKPL